MNHMLTLRSSGHKNPEQSHHSTPFRQMECSSQTAFRGGRRIKKSDWLFSAE